MRRAIVPVLIVFVAACATTEEDRATAAAERYVAAYRARDRPAVLALTEPTRRDRGYDTSIEAPLAEVGDQGVLGVEVVGNWAVVGVPIAVHERARLDALILLMHRRDGAWLVASPFAQGLTEVFMLFADYPDPPPASLRVRPARQFTSVAWSLSPDIPVLLEGRSQVVVLADAGRRGERWLKLSVAHACRVRIEARTDDRASPHMELFAPEGRSCSTRSPNSTKRQSVYFEDDSEALIDRGVRDGTYLLRVEAAEPTGVEISLEIGALFSDAAE